MPEYVYTAARGDGHTVRGRIDADSVEAVGAWLDRGELIPLRVTLRRRALGRWGARAGRASWRIEDKILFTQKLASLLKAGIPILTVLDLIAQQTDNRRVVAAVRRVADLIAGGMTFSDALAANPTLFDPVYVGTVRSGEATGQLDKVLDQTAVYLEREMNTRRRVRETLRYPVMVIVAIMLAAGVIVKFVVPRFLAFYTHFGSQLPAPTRLILAAAGLFSRYWWVPLLGIVAVVIFWRQWTKTAAGEWWRDRMLLRIPLAGRLFLKVAVSRFARLFGLLYSAGIPVTAALETATGGVGNAVVAAEVDAMRERLITGESVSAIPPRAVIPGLVYQMLGIGFESGEVERMLAEVARHYEQEVDYDIRRLSDRLQPILLAFLAAGVLLLALSVFLPIWNLITLFKQ